ncbi:hypothetical protein EDB81DRAFT_787712 [Dactylonectria macrodidyma]|uniref:Zn(2)-C6 fungal-type domain-containing protein n=1 Tax=Dactylonectria macrodidyma TaxID=307937 RepID=A0A9P9FAB8_9HYPO|nr:hypothetical protein EDB81DRAFT_787712 [Dactylonectria macrodidyma]
MSKKLQLSLWIILARTVRLSLACRLPLQTAAPKPLVLFPRTSTLSASPRYDAMATRRPHTKSRLGCTNCKRRKVKCDEVGPVCFHCKRHSLSCSFSNHHIGPVPTLYNRQGESTEQSSNYLTPASIEDHVSDKISPLPPHELWGRNCELMHQFCTITADSLSFQKDVVTVWKNAIPRQGYKHSFIMHGILAIAAAHKAHLDPTNRHTFLPLADYHQTIGSIGYRSMLQHISGENWLAVYSFKSLLMIHMLTQPSRVNPFKLSDPISSLVELIGLVRGVDSTVRPFITETVNYEFRPLMFCTWPLAFIRYLTDHTDLANRCLPLETCEAITKLREYQDSQILADSLHHYQVAVDNLEACFSLAALSKSEIEPGCIFVWLYHLHDDLILDLIDHRPQALLLIAHFSVFLASIENKAWYVTGWARQILDQVVTCLAGQPCPLDLIQWPRRRVYELVRG